uniref:Uncharacterized protein n=1 Tax=viral metagenome TaxID=1070528 RepID=A0A6C0HDU8_9ZZZZ
MSKIENRKHFCEKNLAYTDSRVFACSFGYNKIENAFVTKIITQSPLHKNGREYNILAKGLKETLVGSYDMNCYYL